jgi:serine/threonine protein kinase
MKKTKIQTRKIRFSGGKKIGEGAFGCVYKPSIRCESNTSKRNNTLISKIIDGKFIDDELNFKHDLKRIDPEQNYFIYPLTACKPSVINNSEYKNCKKPNMMLINYKYGGADMMTILEKLNTKPFGKNHIYFFEGFIHLFKGLQLLHNNDIVHLDIKSANIVGEIQKNNSYLFRFIDFGLSKKTDFFTKGDTTRDEYLDPGLLYWNNYFCYPFDLRLLKHQYVNGIIRYTDTDLKQYINYINKMVEEEYGELILPYWLINDSTATPTVSKINTLIDFLRSSKNSTKRTTIFSKLVKNADIYSIGIMLLECFIMSTGILRKDEFTLSLIKNDKIQGSNDFKSIFVTNIVWPMFRLIDSMTRFDFRERSKLDEIINDYTIIINKMKNIFDISNFNTKLVSKKQYCG